MQAQYKPRIRLGTVVAVTLIVLVVPLLAALNALIGPYAVLPYVALASVIAFFALPLNLLMLCCLLAASVFAGLLEYFGGVNQGYWLPFLMGVLFALRALAERLRPAAGASVIVGSAHSSSETAQRLITLLTFLYFAVAIFGLAMAQPPMQQVIIAAKNYFFLWGVLLVLLWSPWRIDFSNAMWTAVVVVACIQWPVVLYQRFVVAAGRNTGVADLDTVVGTHGGSAALAFTSCVAIGVLAWRLREKKLRGVWAALLILVCLIPIALGEVKAAFIWLVVVFALVFGSNVSRDPVRVVVSFLFGVSLLAGLGFIYTSMYREHLGSGVSLEAIYKQQVRYAVDPSEYSAQYHRLGRVAQLVFWWDHHDFRSDPVAMLVGHGIGSSRSSSSLGMGEVARRLRPIAVDSTGASSLLWDVGLLGALVFAALLAVAAVSGLRLGKSPHLSPPWRESTSVAGVVLVLATIGLPYNKDSIDDATVQILIFFSLSQVILASREISRVARALSLTQTSGRTRPLSPAANL